MLCSFLVFFPANCLLFVAVGRGGGGGRERFQKRGLCFSSDSKAQLSCCISTDGWSRVIFDLAANYKSMSRDEREERDYLQSKQHQKQRRRRLVILLSSYLPAFFVQCQCL